MLSMSNKRRFACAWMMLLSLGGAQIGCQKQSTPESGTSQQDLLAVSASLKADLAHVRKLAASSPGGSVELDLSDDAQYRFIRARVAAAGKTPEKYPQFFASLQAIRERQQTRKQQRAVSTLEELNAPTSDHLVGSVLMGPDGQTFEASAFSTIQGGTEYSFLDVVAWNEDQTQQLSEYGWGEVYGDGRKLWARAAGPLSTKDALLYVDSASIVSINGQEVVRFKSITTVAAPGCNVVHPQDNAPTPRDGIVTICLDRNHGDCDYPLVGYRQVQIPLQGSFTFPFPVTSINNTTSTYAKLVEESGGPREMAFGTFFSELHINPDNPRQVWWSVPQHRGIFAGVLFRPYEDVDLFLGIDVTMNRGGRSVQSSVTLASTPGGTSKFVCMPKMQISYSCLAKGTQVKLAGGKSAAIETIAKGSEVLTDGAGVALGVADTSVGIERIPMVRLEDAAGHNLLLTTSHPVMTPDRGVVWAEELAVGDKVMTETGVSTLVKASRETYNGTVHNLKLSNSASTRGSTMYANGFLVGDLAMQKTYEFKNNPKPGADVLAKLPAQWHNDYQSSLKQGTLAARR